MKTTETIEQEMQKPAQKSSQGLLVVLSATLFAMVCAISLFLFFENLRLSSSIEANRNEIVKYTKSIEKIQSNAQVIASELVGNNKDSIAAIIKASEVQGYINEIREISKKYKMILAGFAYDNGKITTSAVSMPETVLAGDDGVKKISHFIADYRTGTGLIFKLSPVLAVSGYEQRRNFSIEFNVANMPQK